MDPDERPRSFLRLDPRVNGGRGCAHGNRSTTTDKQMILEPDFRGKTKVEADLAPTSWQLHVEPISARKFEVVHPAPDSWIDEWGGYRVCLWVPGRVMMTELRDKNWFGEVRWDDKWKVPIKKPLQQVQLHVELVRVGAIEEPGCSSRLTVLGRARYQLDKLSRRESKMGNLFLPLRRPQGGYGGEIEIHAWLEPEWFPED